MELLEQGRRLLRALDANHDGRLSVEECAHLKESAWLFPDEGSFQAVLDPLDCNLVDADLLWSLISDRLERDSEAGREWLQSQWRHLRLRRAPTAGDFSPVCSRSIGLTRTYTKLPTSPGSIGRAWQGFCDALPLDEILSAFKSLSGHLRAGCRHLGVYRKLVERIPTLAIPRFQKQLDSGEAPLDLRLALLGAGPIGLRAALELALLGAQVHVFELRNSFSRMNILKLWDWAAVELLSLGAKDLLPNFLSYMDHIGIRELQALLLKLCLLAGVSFHWRRGFKEVKPSAAGDAVQLTTYKLTEKKEVGGEEVSTFSTLIACDGGKSKVAESLGLQRVRFDGSEAPPTWEVAVVVNFENHKELEDRLLQESPRGFGEEISLVKRLIYLQGETHYFIMTVDVDVLVEHGVLRTGGDAQSVTADGNLHSQELESFAREVVELYSAEVRRLYKENDGAFGIDIPANFWSERQVAVDPAGRPALSIFPYNADLMCLSQPMHLMDSDLPVFFAGDALREPFWPMGEGCSRGFMGALDTVWAVRCWAQGLRGKALLKLRRQLFDCASQVDPRNCGRDVLWPHQEPVPVQGLQWLSHFGRISWPSWGFDGRKRATVYTFTADPSTRYRFYQEYRWDEVENEEEPGFCGFCTPRGQTVAK